MIMVFSINVVIGQFKLVYIRNGKVVLKMLNINFLYSQFVRQKQQMWLQSTLKYIKNVNYNTILMIILSVCLKLIQNCYMLDLLYYLYLAINIIHMLSLNIYCFYNQLLIYII